jgi:hypothetical protein
MRFDALHLRVNRLAGEDLYTVVATQALPTEEGAPPAVHIGALSADELGDLGERLLSIARSA